MKKIRPVAKKFLQRVVLDGIPTICLLSVSIILIEIALGGNHPKSDLIIFFGT